MSETNANANADYRPRLTRIQALSLKQVLSMHLNHGVAVPFGIEPDVALANMGLYAPTPEDKWAAIEALDEFLTTKVEG